MCFDLRRDSDLFTTLSLTWLWWAIRPQVNPSSTWNDVRDSRGHCRKLSFAFSSNCLGNIPGSTYHDSWGSTIGDLTGDEVGGSNREECRGRCSRVIRISVNSKWDIQIFDCGYFDRFGVILQRCCCWFPCNQLNGRNDYSCRKWEEPDRTTFKPNMNISVTQLNLESSFWDDKYWRERYTWQIFSALSEANYRNSLSQTQEESPVIWFVIPTRRYEMQLMIKELPVVVCWLLLLWAKLYKSHGWHSFFCWEQLLELERCPKNLWELGLQLRNTEKFQNIISLPRQQYTSSITISIDLSRLYVTDTRPIIPEKKQTLTAPLGDQSVPCEITKGTSNLWYRQYGRILRWRHSNTFFYETWSL